MREGDQVRAGDVLATLDRRALRLAVQRADALLAVADAGALEMHVRLARVMEDVDVDAVPESAPDETLSDSEVSTTIAFARNAAAQAEVAAREASLDLAQGRLRAARVRSSATGLIATVNADPGAAVSPDQPMFTVVDPGQRLRAVIRVGDGEVGQLRVGQTARVTSPALAGRMFRPDISSVPLLSVADAVANGLPITLIVTNNEASELVAGMPIDVTIEGTTVLDVFLVPEAAVRFAPHSTSAPDDGSAAIWTLLAGVPVRLPVAVGLRAGDLVEVHAETLSEGLPIIIAER